MPQANQGAQVPGANLEHRLAEVAQRERSMESRETALSSREQTLQQRESEHQRTAREHQASIQREKTELAARKKEIESSKPPEGADYLDLVGWPAPHTSIRHVSNQAHVKYLNLRSSAVRSGPALFILNALRQLQGLNVDSCEQLGLNFLKGLHEACPLLRHLRVSIWQKQAPDDRALRLIHDEISQIKMLESLGTLRPSLGGGQPAQNDVSELRRVIRPLSNLTKLGLTIDVSFNPSFVEGDLFAQQSNLRCLKLQNCQRGLIKWGLLLEKMPNLKKLILMADSNGGFEISFPVNFGSHGLSTLEVVQCQNFDLGKLLTHLPNLKHLSIGSSRNAVSARHLTTEEGYKSALEVLKFDELKFHPDDTAQVAEGFSRFARLKELILTIICHTNAVGSQIETIISNGIGRLTRLEALYIGVFYVSVHPHHKVEDLDKAHLAIAKACPKLQHLELGNTIRDPQKVFEAIGTMKQLKSLSLCVGQDTYPLDRLHGLSNLGALTLERVSPDPQSSISASVVSSLLERVRSIEYFRVNGPKIDAELSPHILRRVGVFGENISGEWYQAFCPPYLKPRYNTVFSFDPSVRMDEL